MTTADAISVIVVIMHHVRFLFFCYDQQMPYENLTEEVRGLFPRVAEEIKISTLGSQVVSGEFSLDGRPDSRKNRRALAMSAIKSREKGRDPGRSDGRVRGLGIVTKTRRCATVRRQGFAPEAIVPDKLRSDDAP